MMINTVELCLFQTRSLSVWCCKRKIDLLRNDYIRYIFADAPKTVWKSPLVWWC